MLTLFAALFVFGILVSVHEFGHFAAAKLSGMKVLDFAIGFGPSILQKQTGDTLYSLRIIPLGGYTRVAGMDPDDPDDARNFDRQPLYKRLLVIIAGSAMNLILPVLLFFLVIFSSGVQKPVDLPVLGTIMPDHPAALAGLSAGDTIAAVDGQPIHTWVQLVEAVRAKGNQQIRLLVKRGQQELTVDITPQHDEATGRGMIGVMPEIEHYRPGLGESVKLSVLQTYNLGVNMIEGLCALLLRRQQADLAGPLGVAHIAGQVAQHGFLPLLNFTAFLSINLGIINMLPVPVLDGGYVVTLLIEGVRGRALDPKTALRAQYVGLFLLISLLAFSTLQDIIRLNLF